MKARRKQYEVVVRAYLWRLDEKDRALRLAADIRRGCAWLPMRSRWFIKTAVRESLRPAHAKGKGKR